MELKSRSHSAAVEAAPDWANNGAQGADDDGAEKTEHLTMAIMMLTEALICARIDWRRASELRKQSAPSGLRQHFEVLRSKSMERSMMSLLVDVGRPVTVSVGRSASVGKGGAAKSGC